MIIREKPAKMLGNPVKMAMCHHTLMTHGLAKAGQYLGSPIKRMVSCGGRMETGDALISPLDITSMTIPSANKYIFSRSCLLQRTILYEGGQALPCYLTLGSGILRAALNGWISRTTYRDLFSNLFSCKIVDVRSVVDTWVNSTSEPPATVPSSSIHVADVLGSSRPYTEDILDWHREKMGTCTEAEPMDPRNDSALAVSINFASADAARILMDSIEDIWKTFSTGGYTFLPIPIPIAPPENREGEQSPPFIQFTSEPTSRFWSMGPSGPEEEEDSEAAEG